MAAGANGRMPNCLSKEENDLNSVNKFLQNDYLGLIVRLTIGVIFIYASIDKIGAPAQFARIVYNYHFLPGSLINFFALVMPWIEIICGILLIAGIYKEGSILILDLMIIAFIIAIGVNLFRGINLECGCFSVSSKAKDSALDLLLRDIGLLVLGIYAYLNRSQRFSLMKTRV